MRDKLQSELASPHADTGGFREFAGAKVSLAPEALRRIRALTVPAGASSGAGAGAAASAADTGVGGTTDSSGASGAGSSPSDANQGAGSPAGVTSSPGAAAGTVPSGTTGSGAAVTSASAGGFSANFPLSSGTAGESARPAPAAIPSLLNVSVPEGCSFCGGTLPEGRAVIYCPHCGNNLSVSRCPACGGELEKGWKFCVSCGRSVV
jgi:predicted RNA-binding Zn-ribbon protein involved in translation (DUF1610 family)